MCMCYKHLSLAALRNKIPRFRALRCNTENVQKTYVDKRQIAPKVNLVVVVVVVIIVVVVIVVVVVFRQTVFVFCAFYFSCLLIF